MIAGSVAVEGRGPPMGAGAEFLPPLPKPAPLLHRYNNGCRVPAPHHTYYGPYASLYPAPYAPLRYTAPLDAYRHSPPVAPGYLPQPYSPPPAKLRRPFKVPSGKEGSLKHRILTRPSQQPAPTEGATVSRPLVKPLKNFTKGSLIELATGELRRVEDMRTEDFVLSAEKSSAHRLDPSTVVRMDELPGVGARLTFSHGENRSVCNYDCPIDHPFFVYGQGWASCDPELSLKNYGLHCHLLKVGDVCITLSPRRTLHAAETQSGACSASPSSHQNHRKRRWSAPDHLNENGSPPTSRPRE